MLHDFHVIQRYFQTEEFAAKSSDRLRERVTEGVLVAQVEGD